MTSEQHNKIIELRKSGASFQDIADHLGTDKSTAMPLIREALDDLAKTHRHESTEAGRALDIERLDMLLMIAMEKAKKGSHEAIKNVLQILERRAKLRGLDAPTKTVSSVFGNLTDDELLQEAHRLGVDVTDVKQITYEGDNDSTLTLGGGQ